MRYRLQSVDGVPEVPAWWNAGGTAFHECVREYEMARGTEREEDTDWHAERFAHHLAEATAQMVLDDKTGSPLSQWRAARRGTENRDWWLDHGPEMVAKYVAAQQGREYEVLTIDGAVGMEWGFEVELIPGLPAVKGFIDHVLVWPKTGEITVRDLKSGSSAPADPFQLSVYRLALEHLGVTATRWWGDYWMGRKGAPTRAWDLSDRDRLSEGVAYRLRAMDAQERAGYYAPNPSSLCNACGVLRACPAHGLATALPWSRVTPQQLTSQ
jgi:hypothetical protein